MEINYLIMFYGILSFVLGVGAGAFYTLKRIDWLGEDELDAGMTTIHINRVRYLIWDSHKHEWVKSVENYHVDAEGKIVRTVGGELQYLPHLTPIMSTGLTDSNGGTVYDGSLLEDEVGEVYIVEYKDGLYLARYVSGEYSPKLLKDYIAESEIIGHLLERGYE